MISTHFDIAIVGQGLAGTAMAWSLRWAGFRVVVIDRGTGVTPSKIAAGLVTPITGKTLVRTWRYHHLWPSARDYYARVQRETGGSFFHELGMVRLFDSDDEPALFERRRATGDYQVWRGPRGQKALVGVQQEAEVLARLECADRQHVAGRQPVACERGLDVDAFALTSIEPD